MFLWRISGHADLKGLGGELQNGRWHRAAVDKRIVYLSEHPAVALLENLSGLRGDPTLFPDSFQLLKVAADDTVSLSELTPTQFDSISPEDVSITQAIGDAWLASRASALLRVPSIPSPESWNYLLNPLHPDASQIRVDWAKPIGYDRCLFHLSR